MVGLEVPVTGAVSIFNAFPYLQVGHALISERGQIRQFTLYSKFL